MYQVQATESIKTKAGIMSDMDTVHNASRYPVDRISTALPYALLLNAVSTNTGRPTRRTLTYVFGFNPSCSVKVQLAVETLP